MYIALGFCLAGLASLAVFPAFYKRAVRLTKEALHATNPTTYAEVRAAQDQALARHAVDFRRLELKLEAERAAVAQEMQRNGGLKTEILDLQETHASELKAMQDELLAAQKKLEEAAVVADELTTAQSRIQSMEKTLAAVREEAEGLRQERNAKLGWIPPDETAATTTIANLETEVAVLKTRVAEAEARSAAEYNVRPELDLSNHQAIITELERQLVDAEANYIGAQSDVARLTAQIDAGPSQSDDYLNRVSDELRAMHGEVARLKAEIQDRERALSRARSQLQRLQADLKQPLVAEMRSELHEIVKAIQASKSATAKEKQTQSDALVAPLQSKAKRSPSTAKNQKPKAANNGAGSSQPNNESSKAPPSLPGPADGPKPETSTTTARDLVRRVVKAQSRNKHAAPADNEAVAAASDQTDAHSRTKKSAAKQTSSRRRAKKMDVA